MEVKKEWQEIQMDKQRSKDNLDKTRSHIKVWGSMSDTQRHTYGKELEELIVDMAKQEWGNDTLIECFIKTGHVLIVNQQKNKTIIIDKNGTTVPKPKEME